MLDPRQTVANLVLDHSECVEVFQRHRIDFCCRGDMSLETAAKERGVALEALLSELSNAVAERRGDPAADPREFSTPRLVSYVISKHHEYLRKALPVVRALATKVSGVHGEHNPKLRGLDKAVGELQDALIPHLDEEEQVLFPALMSKNPDVKALSGLLASMVDEHHSVARLLERIHAASDAFTVPEWACNSYRTLFSELRQLEADVFAHVHLENHVLKPRFAA